MPFSRLTGSLRSAKSAYLPLLSRSWRAMEAFFGHGRNAEKNAVLSLVRTIITVDGDIPAHNLELFRQLAEENYGVSTAGKQLEEMLSLPPQTSAEAAAAVLIKLDKEEKRRIAVFLIELSIAANRNQWHLVSDLIMKLGFSAEELQDFVNRSETEYQSRKRLLHSGAGLWVALIVLAVFILTATLLRSVIFGLIIAYLLLPLEKFFERRLREKRGLIYRVLWLLEMIPAPLYALSRKLTRRNAECAVDPQQRHEEHLIQQAVGITSVIGLAVLLALLMFLTSLTGKYVVHISDSVRQWNRQQTTVAPTEGTAERKDLPAGEESFNRILNSASNYLEDLRQKFEQLPLVKMAISSLEKLLTTPESRNELLKFLIQKTGGLFSLTAGVFGTIFSLLCDLLLTIFFAMLFLLKLAQFCRNAKTQDQASEYLVKTIFNGSWLPNANAQAMAEGQRIISGTINRLQIWAKGYLTLMLIDGTVYSTVFFLLQVPYFPILGLIAGCGILLPYIGPILSALLTLLVTLAVGGASGEQLFGILATQCPRSGS